jgi:hypothetical protein
MERRTSAAETLLTDAVLDKYDTLIIISFDSQRPQVVDPGAPPHPVVPPGSLFDSVLQARPEARLGRLTVCDTTLWTSVFGGLEGLHVFWKNVITAQAR